MNTTPERGPHRTIRSVEIAFDIVDALQERDRVDRSDWEQGGSYAIDEGCYSWIGETTSVRPAPSS